MTRIRDATLAELRDYRPEDGELSTDRRWTGLLWKSSEGFTWRDDLSPWGDDPPGPFLVAAGQGRDHYEPLTRSRHGDIQDGFAALAGQHAAEGDVTDALRDSILGYADRFGFLGVGQPLYPAHGPVDVDAPVPGESVTRWAAQLADYHALHTAWTWASMPETEQRRIDLPEFVVPEGGDLLLCIGRASVRLRDRLHWKGLSGAILEAVAFSVSERLSKEMRPAVWVGKPLRFQPTSLLGVIYLGFALRLGVPARPGKGTIHCRACGNLISRRRRDQRYCDGNCRQRGHRMGLSKTKPSATPTTGSENG